MKTNINTRNFESRVPNVEIRSSLFDISYSILAVRASVFCILYSVFCLLSGCQQHDSSVPKTAIPDLSDSVKKAEVMQITRDVLAEMNFEIEKYDPPVSSVPPPRLASGDAGAGEDRNGGYIKTRPLEGAQFFEFWRCDNVGAQNWLLGNLHSIRRTVEINIYENIDCVVHIQRLSMPEQEVTSSARAYSMFSRSSPALQTLRLNPEQQQSMKWIDLGRDKELENEIVKRIETKILSVHKNKGA
jgi:hypothetical protein